MYNEAFELNITVMSYEYLVILFMYFVVYSYLSF